MNEVLLQSVVDELSTVLRGRIFGKIFQLSKQSLAIDFRSGDGRYLYINLDSSDPRIFLISRKLKEIEKTIDPPIALLSIAKKTIEWRSACGGHSRRGRPNCEIFI